jgi:hypothetical protein
MQPIEHIQHTRIRQTPSQVRQHCVILLFCYFCYISRRTSQAGPCIAFWPIVPASLALQMACQTEAAA